MRSWRNVLSIPMSYCQLVSVTLSVVVSASGEFVVWVVVSPRQWRPLESLVKVRRAFHALGVFAGFFNQVGVEFGGVGVPRAAKVEVFTSRERAVGRRELERVRADLAVHLVRRP